MTPEQRHIIHLLIGNDAHLATLYRTNVHFQLSLDQFVKGVIPAFVDGLSRQSVKAQAEFNELVYTKERINEKVSLLSSRDLPGSLDG